MRGSSFVIGTSLVVASLSCVLGALGCAVDESVNEPGDEPGDINPRVSLPTDQLLVEPTGPVVIPVLSESYEVPLPPDQLELLPFATFSLDFASAWTSGDSVEIHFQLPFGLTGVATTVMLTGPINPEQIEGQLVNVTSSYGGGTCMVNQFFEPTVCELTYAGLSFDRAAVETYWRDQGDANVLERLRVTQLFENDPLGVLRVEFDAF